MGVFERDGVFMRGDSALTFDALLERTVPYHPFPVLFDVVIILQERRSWSPASKQERFSQSDT